jgi:hypothetical protein
MPRPWKDGDAGGEKVEGKGKGRDVREPKRQGSLAIATSEQAEGRDVTRKVSLEPRFFVLILILFSVSTFSSFFLRVLWRFFFFFWGGEVLKRGW